MTNRILIGEDNLVAQQVLRELLAELNTELVFAATGDEIIAALKQHKFDLLLLDFNLDRSADLIINEIHSLGISASTLPVYILSGEPQKVIEKKMKGITYQGYLPKPVTRAALKDVVMKVANKPLDNSVQPISLTKLETLVGNPTKVQRIIATFMNEAPLLLAKMEQLIKNKNWPELKSVVHRAKAGYGYLGVDDLHQQLSVWEHLISQEHQTERYSGYLQPIKRGTELLIRNLSKKTPLPTTASVSKHTAIDPLAKGCKILLVDDSVAILKYLESVLIEMGAEVTTAVNGMEAIQFVEAVKPELIIMDIHMPELNGIDAIVEIRRLGIKVPIVAISNSTLYNESARALEAGATEFVTKPIPAETIVALLKRHFKGSYTGN